MKIIFLRHAKSSSFLINREFFIYDLCYGEYPFFFYTGYMSKVPRLDSYFPLYAYANDYIRIPSFGDLPVFLTPGNYLNKSSFQMTPISLLNISKGEFWESNIISLPKNIPSFTQTFLYKFDVISNIKRKDGININITTKFFVFSLKITKPNNNLLLKVGIYFVLNSVGFNSFEGQVTVVIFKIQNGMILETKNKTFDILESRIDINKIQWVNKMNSTDIFTNRRIKKLGFYQVVSPQTIIIKVRK